MTERSEDAGGPKPVRRRLLRCLAGGMVLALAPGGRAGHAAVLAALPRTRGGRAQAAHGPAAPAVVGRASAPKPLVMLDPGHGGKDPGAIGASGTFEKHIAHAAALELHRQLLAEGQVRVALTRADDVFIPLEDRVAIAQSHAAALFVSMHADALHDRSVRGASVYTLSDGASDAQTAALARTENSSDRFAGPHYGGATSPEVQRILASLVRRETRIGSAHMAGAVVASFRPDGIGLLSNPSRHAAFVVLKAADIPSVLVEMGFMSNPADEAQLKRADHRQAVATAMRQAINRWLAASPTLDRMDA